MKDKIVSERKNKLKRIMEVYCHPPKLYMLSFHKDDEKEILEAILKLHSLFFVLKISSLKSIESFQNHLLFCDRYTASDALKSILKNGRLQLHNEFPDYLEILDMEFILLPIDDDFIYKYGDMEYRSAVTNYLLSNLNQFYLEQLICHKNTIVVKLTDCVQENKRNICDDKYNHYIIPFGGIGDYFMMYSLIQEYILKKENENYNITFIYLENDIKAKSQLDLYFPDYDTALINNEYMGDFCFKCFYDNVMDIQHRFPEIIRTGVYNHGEHLTEIIRHILDIDKSMYIYKHNEKLIKNVYRNINFSDKKYIDSLFQDDQLIVFQCFTGWHNEKGDYWVADMNRNWSEENMNEFITMCNDKGVKLVALSDCPYSYNNIHVLKKMSLPSYIYAISKCKLVIGVDSSAGHIASFYSIPSITLWGNIAPVVEMTIASPRALRKNVSLYSKTKNINEITPIMVFDVMDDILSGELILEDNVQGYHDDKNLIAID